MKEGEYVKRLSSCLMKHYGSGMEIHLYTECDEIEGISFSGQDCVLMDEDFIKREEIPEGLGNKLLVLTEEEPMDTAEPYIWKYQTIPNMVERIQKTTGRNEGKVSVRGERIR